MLRLAMDIADAEEAEASVGVADQVLRMASQQGAVVDLTRID